MGFPPGLVSEMVGLDEDVIGVIAPKRTFDLSRLHSLGSEPFEIAYARACEFIGKPGSRHPRNPSFAEVDSCGAGILLIARKCVAKMIDCMPEAVDGRRFKKMPFGGKFPSFLTFFDKIELNDRVLSEDISFCYWWREWRRRQVWGETLLPCASVRLMPASPPELRRVIRSPSKEIKRISTSSP